MRAVWMFASVFGLVMAAQVLSGCVANQAAGPGPVVTADGSEAASRRVSLPNYTIFHDQGDHLRALVEHANFDDAARLAEEQAAWFAEERRRARFAPLLEQVIAHHRDPWLPALESAAGGLADVAWPAPAERWAAMRAALDAARAALEQKRQFGVLMAGPLAVPEAVQLAARVEAHEAVLRDAAPGAFAAHDHFTGPAFFETYPLAVPPDRLLTEAVLTPLLAQATTVQLGQLAAAYGRHDDTLARRAGTAFIPKFLAENGIGQPDLTAMLRAYTAARAAGLAPDSIPGFRLAFVQATSRTLLQQGQIEFPAAVDVDLPFAASELDLDAALAEGGEAEPDVVIAFDVALARASRRVVESKSQPSQLVTALRTVPNPVYRTVQMEIQKLQMDLQAARSREMMANMQAQTCYGFACIAQAIGGIAAAAAVGRADEALRAKMEVLATTPLTVDEPVFGPYNFSRTQINAAKTMTVHYYVIDRRKREYFKSTFDVSERRTFEVVYNVHETDPRREDHIVSAEREQDVLDWEAAPVPVRLSDLIAQFAAQSGSRVAYAGPEALRQVVLADRNRALARAETVRQETSAVADPRFDSVVVVYGKGRSSIGSGFFVAPDLVLTNWHVVEEIPFVEMVMHDRQETFGRVVAKDVRLDLALVRVQSRGRPVRLYEGSPLELGRSLDAIGHPRGLRFTITRGVVSAIRRHPSINLRGGGGAPVLYIQTDTPISPGNSGGPLFQGDRVVGVNTWGRTDGQGLNFAVHYTELRDFLAENAGAAWRGN